MALIKCFKCGRMVSDKAESCPGCGTKVPDILAAQKNNTGEKNVESDKPLTIADEGFVEEVISPINDTEFEEKDVQAQAGNFDEEMKCDNDSSKEKISEHKNENTGSDIKQSVVSGKKQQEKDRNLVKVFITGTVCILVIILAVKFAFFNDKEDKKLEKSNENTEEVFEKENKEIVDVEEKENESDIPSGEESEVEEPKEPEADEPEEIEGTVSQINALKRAESYLSHSAFSYGRLIAQLEYEQFSHDDAVYAVDNCEVDWNEQALKKAESYLSNSAFSYSRLIEQLEYEQFTHEQAVYAVDNCVVDWNEQAVKKAESYLSHSAFSRGRLIDQLEYEGFTSEQAEYGVNAVGL